MKSDQIGRIPKGNNTENPIKESECLKIVIDKNEPFALLQGGLFRGS